MKVVRIKQCWLDLHATIIVSEAKPNCATVEGLMIAEGAKVMGNPRKPPQIVSTTTFNIGSHDAPPLNQGRRTPVFADPNFRFNTSVQPQNVSFPRPRFTTICYYGPRRSPKMKVAALFTGAGLFLSMCAFGFKNCFGALVYVCNLLSVCLTPNGFALTCFAGLGVLVAVATFWTWAQITARYSYVQIGLFMAGCGLALGLLTFGSFHYHVQIPPTPLFFMGVASVCLLGRGLVMWEMGKEMIVQQTATSAGNRDTIYGDARAAFDHEIDQAARGKTGGFGPMFRD